MPIERMDIKEAEEFLKDIMLDETELKQYEKLTMGLREDLIRMQLEGVSQVSIILMLATLLGSQVAYSDHAKSAQFDVKKYAVATFEKVYMEEVEKIKDLVNKIPAAKLIVNETKLNR